MYHSLVVITMSGKDSELQHDKIMDQYLHVSSSPDYP